jgi:tetratricopeptide (TPR) repeat protein
MDTNAFALYTVLLPGGSINYALPYQFIQEIGRLRWASVKALIQTGIAKEVGSDRLVLTEHPFQIRHTLKQEGLVSVPVKLRQWFKYKFQRSSPEPTVSNAVLARYLADPSQAGTRLNELVHHAEWSGVREHVADALKLLLEYTEWDVDSETKEKATADYHTLTRRSFPEDEEQFVKVLKNQRTYWVGLREAAEQSGELKVGSERLDRILYEIAYIDYLLESYDQAVDTFRHSVDAALEAITRGMEADRDDPAQKDGSNALARFWVSAVLEKSSALRHYIRQYLSEREADADQRINTVDVSRIVKEAASIWRKLQEANRHPKEQAHRFYIDALRLIRPGWQPPSNGSSIIRTPEMEEWLARHEHSAYLHSREMSCWPMLFGLSNQRIDIDVPEPEEHQSGLTLSTPDVGLPFYRAQGIDLLCRWTQHSNRAELSDAVLATAAMTRAGGGYEYLGDLLLLAWRCTPSSETADMLKWYLHNRIPSVGFNGLPKTALDAIESARRRGLPWEKLR